jgi:hypothetical protein
MYQSKPTGEIGKAMQFKQAGIEKSQRSTQDSIRVSGSATDATLMVAAMIPYMVGLDGKNLPDEKIREKWEEWRKYFFEQRDINETFKKLSEPF